MVFAKLFNFTSKGKDYQVLLTIHNTEEEGIFIEMRTDFDICSADDSIEFETEEQAIRYLDKYDVKKARQFRKTCEKIINAPLN